VNEINKFNLEPNSPLDVHTDNEGHVIDEEEDEFGELRYDGGVLVQDRKFMVRRCLRKGNHPRYAIKTLSEECLNGEYRHLCIKHPCGSYPQVSLTITFHQPPQILNASLVA